MRIIDIVESILKTNPEARDSDKILRNILKSRLVDIDDEPKTISTMSRARRRIQQLGNYQ